jgi:hypothetical protein
MYALTGVRPVGQGSDIDIDIGFGMKLVLKWFEIEIIVF